MHAPMIAERKKLRIIFPEWEVQERHREGRRDGVKEADKHKFYSLFNALLRVILHDGIQRFSFVQGG